MTRKIASQGRRPREAMSVIQQSSVVHQYYQTGMASHKREIINPKIIPCHSSVICIFVNQKVQLFLIVAFSSCVYKTT